MADKDLVNPFGGFQTLIAQNLLLAFVAPLTGYLNNVATSPDAWDAAQNFPKFNLGGLGLDAVKNQVVQNMAVILLGLITNAATQLQSGQVVPPQQ